MTRTSQDILDEFLVLRCQDRDSDALRELVERYQPRFWRHAMYLTGRRDGAEEVVQETWLAIVRGLSRLRDPAAFQPWAYRMVARRSADWIRRRRRDRARTEDAADPDEAQVATNASPPEGDELHALRCAIHNLPAHLRSALSMHYQDGLSVKEIAYALDIPPGTVKSRLHHARNILKQTLERNEQ